MARGKLTIYLPDGLQERMERIAAQQGRSVSSVIVEAVETRYRKEGEADPALRLATRLEARIDKAVRDTIMVKETLLLFVRVWLEHNPPLDEALEESAAASAAARFERFLDFVADAIGSGRSLALFEPARAQALEEVSS